eukprot:TRINITY_DN347_c1_g1_i4.p1 TRINITY_DN347_c1_g1~~TRINITY_DN347_c1_g1_i4.p1  ORF type:complete len:291 (-),score=83.70 TRINITY_DN347_c1_g1_i4:80-952(-)
MTGRSVTFYEPDNENRMYYSESDGWNSQGSYGSSDESSFNPGSDSDYLYDSDYARWYHDVMEYQRQKQLKKEKERRKRYHPGMVERKGTQQDPINNDKGEGNNEEEEEDVNPWGTLLQDKERFGPVKVPKLRPGADKEHVLDVFEGILYQLRQREKRLVKKKHQLIRENLRPPKDYWWELRGPEFSVEVAKNRRLVEHQAQVRRTLQVRNDLRQQLHARLARGEEITEDFLRFEQEEIDWLEEMDAVEEGLRREEGRKVEESKAREGEDEDEDDEDEPFMATLVGALMGK